MGNCLDTNCGPRRRWNCRTSAQRQFIKPTNGAALSGPISTLGHRFGGRSFAHSQSDPNTILSGSLWHVVLSSGGGILEPC